MPVENGPSFARHRMTEEPRERRPVMTVHSHKVLDVRGVPSPWALLNISAAYRELAPNTYLEILVDDAATKDDVLLLLLREAVCEVIQELTDGAPAVFQVRARKRHPL